MSALSFGGVALMGGYGSGRRAGRATVEAGLVLNLAHLIRRGIVVPGQHRRGKLTWMRPATGKPVAEIGYEACMRDPAASWLRLTYTIERPGGSGRQARDDRVA